MFYCYCGIWIWQKQDGGLSSFSENTMSLLEYYKRTIGPMWTNFDQCGPILTDVHQWRFRSPPACKDHHEVAAKWQKCRFPIANMQFRSTNCRQCPHNLLAGIIIRQRLNRQSGAGRQTWFDPNLTSFHASASYCLLLPLLPPSLLGKLLVLHLTTSACKR